MVRVPRVSVRLRWAKLAVAVLAALTVFMPSPALARPGSPTHGRPKPEGPKGGGKGAGKRGGHGRGPRGPRLKPALPLPVLATLRLVDLAVDGGLVVVSEAFQLARNEWERGDLRVCIGHGAPGAPKAFDAKFESLDTSPKADGASAGQTLATEFAPFCPVNARLLLGGAHMATQVVTIPATAITSAFGNGELALLRIRFLIEAPPKDRDGGRELLLRLGAPEDAPITLASIAIASRVEKVAVTRAEATLCGPSADPASLTVEGAPSTLATLNPSLAIRRASDELCVRYWTNTR